MSRVRVLSEILAHQIAAGEIVERPASVVKELVENSIDAEAGRIEVRVVEGGKSEICVADNGFGMSAEDAKLAFEHHATSKINQLEDLRGIATLGFRGEALPAIASVSRTRLRTVDRDQQKEDPCPGTEIVYEGGRCTSVREMAWPKGTEIVVSDLFYNVPARRKFLKTVSTEIGHISRLVTCYALAYPAIEFKLDHQDRNVFTATAVQSLTDRVYQVLGDKYADLLIPIRYGTDDVRVHGLASLPHEQRNNSTGLYLFVNGRMVRDRVLTHAIRQAYRDLIPSQAYPVVILFVDTDARMVDVNVHPTKVEIRFRNSQIVHRSILRAIEQGLLRHRSSLSSLARDIPFTPPDSMGPDPTGRSKLGGFARYRSDHELFQGSSRGHFDRTGPGPPIGELDEVLLRKTASSTVHADEIPETTHISTVPVTLGQFVESFVVAVDRDGVMLIDQHVAHERILYDRALKRLKSDQSVPTQRLLMPLTIELDAGQRAIAEEILDYLTNNGFDVEWFGRQTLIVRGIPALAENVDPRRLFEQLFREFAELDELDSQTAEPDRGLTRVRQKIAISFSCRAAIKINTPLTGEKMQWLIDELFRCQNPYTCPHGRPIVLRLEIAEILKGFKRI